MAENPAAELLRLCQAITDTPNGQSGWTLFAKHFEPDNTSPPDTDRALRIRLTAELAKLTDLHRQMQDLVAQKGQSGPEFFDATADMIASFLATGFDAASQVWKAAITNEAMTQLNMNSLIIGAVSADVHLDMLDSIEEGLASILADLQSPDSVESMSIELRGFLLHHVAAMLRSIRMYDIYGNEGFTRVMQDLATDLMTSPDTAREPAVQSVLKRVGDLFYQVPKTVRATAFWTGLLLNPLHLESVLEATTAVIEGMAPLTAIEPGSVPALMPGNPEEE